jgi:hypothetical protein
MAKEFVWKCHSCESDNEFQPIENNLDVGFFKICDHCETTHLLSIEDSSVKVLTQMSRE